jgi:hypothetical protein
VPAECKGKGVVTAQDFQAVKSDPDVVAGKLLLFLTSSASPAGPSFRIHILF